MECGKEVQKDLGDIENLNRDSDKINQSQFYDLITGEDVSWQAIIYDLIKTEQLDPWNIDLGVLADKYVLVISEIEEANFFVSSKVLLACSLLLRLKSEILLNKQIQGLDEILYGRKPVTSYELEREVIDEDELPILVPRTPIPRNRRVTLEELMASLNKAIETGGRRIIREIKGRQAEKSALVVLPKIGRIPLKTRIHGLFTRIKGHLKRPEVIHMKFSELAPSPEEKRAAFLPILHLSNQEKVWLRQEEHFNEIFMTLEQLQEELDEFKKQLGDYDSEEYEVEGFKEGIKALERL